MAPPVVLLDRHSVSIPKECELKTLLQYECQLNDNEIICLPLQRLFKQCLSGKSRQASMYEITDPSMSIPEQFSRIELPSTGSSI